MSVTAELIPSEVVDSADSMLAPAKFASAHITACGKRRAKVQFAGMQMLWFNTGTLCNLACNNCYIESSPRNDRLEFLNRIEVDAFLEEAEALDLGVKEIGFTGGEPFVNPDFLEILSTTLSRRLGVLVLTNAMRPMMKHAEGLLDLRNRYGNQLALRVSVDHFRPELHEEERGARSWTLMMRGLHWLYQNEFNLHLAARLRWGDDERTMRDGFERLMRRQKIKLDVWDPQRLVLFPEMNESADTPEITTDCWNSLGVRPEDQMCATSRMVVKRRGAKRPTVVSCTLLPYADAFDLGPTLANALGDIPLNHPHCSRFCVLGGGKCAS